ncbi:MAG: sulfatase-like hydrolase/transferase [Candidatus Omnitrophota bacterium]
MNKENKLAHSLVVVSFFVLTVFFFVPLHLYLANLNNFNFYSSFFRLVLTCFKITITLIFLLYLLTAYNKNIDRFKKNISTLFVLGFLFWFNANILVWDYGLFDGKHIDWGKFHYRGIIDIGVYILTFTLLTRKTNLVYSFAKKTSIILILIQLFSLIFSYINSKNDTSIAQRHECTIDSSNKFRFSEEKNVIILVLDSFQSDWFNEIIEHDKTMRNNFAGFTYYRNALGAFPVTEFSTPVILTGKYYDNTLPIDLFIEKAYLSSSCLPKKLKENGFLVDLYAYVRVLIDKRIASNYIKNTIDPKPKTNENTVRTSANDEFFDIIQLYDAALFRIMPHYFRRYIYNNRTWFLKRIFSLNNIQKILTFKTGCDLKLLPDNPEELHNEIIYSENTLNNDFALFTQNAVNNISLDSPLPTFKYYHLSGFHPPLCLDENLKIHYNNLPQTRKSFISCAKGHLKITLKFLEILKENNLYDNSLIFIIGDHGSNCEISGFEQIGASKKSDYFSYNNLECKISRALPLILVKPFKTNTQLQVSDAPVGLNNIAPTIFQELKIQADILYPSIFDINENNQITRNFFVYFAGNNHNHNYLEYIHKFEINGLSWYPESWKFIEEMLPATARRTP